jgi:hypothetical protein
MDNNQNDGNVKIPRISEEDAYVTIKIIEKALEYRPAIKEAIMGEKFMALSEGERVSETLTARIAKHQVGKLPCIFFRSVGDDVTLAEGIFYPIESVFAFLDEARFFYKKHRRPEQTDEDIEKIAVDTAVEMFLIMLDNFYQRILLMAGSFVEETIAEWHYLNRKRLLRLYSEKGNKIDRVKDSTLKSCIDDYSKKLLQLWEYQGQTEENYLKIRLAEEYDGGIYDHWNFLGSVVSKHNWRIYSKPEPFEDTPDDLLEQLENRIDRRNEETTKRKLSELAIEHAARRVGLVKVYTSKTVYEKRKAGVNVTDYDSGTLFGFLKEGRDLIAQLKARREAEQSHDSAQLKNKNLVEQNMKYIQTESEKSEKPNSDSAQGEKE